MKTAYVIAGLIILFIVILPIIINLTGYSYSLVSKNVTKMYKTVRDKFEYKDKAMLLFLVGCNNGIIYIKNDQYLIYKLHDQSQIISQEKNELEMVKKWTKFLIVEYFKQDGDWTIEHKIKSNTNKINDKINKVILKEFNNNKYSYHGATKKERKK